MKIIYYILAMSILLLISCKTQKNTKIVNPKIEQSTAETKDEFPTDWIGEYRGALEIFNAKGKVMEVDMGLEIGSSEQKDFHPWVLKYGTEDIREYGLKKTDTIPGHFVIDEFNGIFIDCYAMGNTLVSHFSVGNSEITSIYQKMDDKIEFQIISSKSDTLLSSRAEEDGQVYEVGSFPVNVYQKAILTRINKE